MADPPSKSSRPSFLSKEHPPASSRLSSAARSSHESIRISPPSEPRVGSRSTLRSLDGVVDRPARFQLIVALVLGLVLVVIPLYLWRRPRVQLASATTTESSNTAAVPTTIPSIAAPSVEGGMEPKVALSDVKIVACQDSGAKKIPPEQCDRVVELEKLFTKAISESAACIPKDAGGGTIIYVLDMNFKKKFFSIHTPKEGRTFKNAALVGGCQIGVKAKLRTLSDDPFVHQHHHYKLSVTAVYPGSIKP